MGRKGAALVSVIWGLPGCDCSGGPHARAPVDAGCLGAECERDVGASLCEETPSAEGCPCDRGAPPDKCFTGPPEAAGVGRCARGLRRCLADGWSECFDEIVPGFEWCNGMDDDCDGAVDDDCGPCAGECEYRIDDDRGDASGGHVVLDGAGLATVAWVEDGSIVSARRGEGAAWRPIETFGVGTFVALAANEAGAVVLMSDGWSVRFGDDGWTDSIWGGAAPLELAMDPAGTAYSASCHGSSSQLADGTWATLVVGPRGCHVPDVAVTPSGGAIVLWATDDDLFFWAPELGPATTSSLAVEPIPGAPAISVGLAADGTAVALWIDSTNRLFVAWRAAGGEWSLPEEIAEGDSTTEIALADAPSGALTAVWSHESRILASSYDPGGTWSEPARLDWGTRLGAGIDAKVCGDDVVAVWSQAEGAASRIRTSRLRDGDWEPPSVLSTQHRWDAERPDLACAPSGEAIVVWEQRLGDSGGIHAVRIPPAD